MKPLQTFLCGLTFSALLFTSCQRDTLDDTVITANDRSAESYEQTSANAKKNPSGQVCNPNAYIITLESRTYINGQWEWVWSIENPNPGNGNNGTAQDLSNWGMQLGACVDWASVSGAAYSGNGVNWTNFTPSYEVNPSQGCLTTPVLKFDFGTSGNARSYYKLVVTQDYAAGAVTGYYKSGSNTSCCTVSFTGIGCGGPVEIEDVE
ncbi:MAG: hypothetical protein JNK14_11235 [Chitinophagaceae bacterium]|nr:hypothetical protein [Chitinophagaceae bacterium]